MSIKEWPLLVFFIFHGRLTIADFEAHRINIVITELITRLITLAISEPRPSEAYFTFADPLISVLPENEQRVQEGLRDPQSAA